MPKFRKKPVVIEAFQWDGTDIMAEHLRQWSDHQVRAHGGASCFVDTLEGTMEAKPGDYIIRGVQGEFYPCKPDIFEMTYEAAD